MQNGESNDTHGFYVALEFKGLCNSSTLLLLAFLFSPSSLMGLCILVLAFKVHSLPLFFLNCFPVVIVALVN